MGSSFRTNAYFVSCEVGDLGVGLVDIPYGIASELIIGSLLAVFSGSLGSWRPSGDGGGSSWGRMFILSGIASDSNVTSSFCSSSASQSGSFGKGGSDSCGVFIIFGVSLDKILGSF